MTSIDQVRDYYDITADREDERLLGRQLEHDVVIERLKEYLPPQASVLEIGAGSGRYTAWLAANGYAVTAIDLSPALVAKCAARCQALGLHGWRAVAADARTLYGIGGGFDAALVMGPMYHLPDEDDRRAVLDSARKRLAPDGLLFSVWLNRYGILGQLLVTSPDWIDDSVGVGKLLRTGRFNDDDSWYCGTVETIPAFHERAGFKTVRFGPLDPGIFGTDEMYNLLPPDRRRRWLAALLRLAEEPSMVGHGRHLLYIGRKSR